VTAPDTLPGDGDLRAAVIRLARVPQLLVACDYDGTLAPIVEDPEHATPLPEAIAALRALAALPQTTVAVISGRALRDLAMLSRLPSEVHLVGSHGSEFDVGFVHALAPELQQLRTRLYEALTELVRGQPGVRLESKPASVAVHTRGADRAVAQRTVAAVDAGPGTWEGVHVTVGKEVVELSVLGTHKGYAVDQLRMQAAANAVLYLGDDVTDENAFAHLHGADLGIKIGPGETRAGYRVPDPESAVRTLGFLLERRRRWLFGERAVPIERHSMLANGRQVALLTPDARVTWLCHPRPDSAAIFADLLGGPGAGHFSIAPARGGLPKSQTYRDRTMTVETEWAGLTVIDWLDGDTGVPYEELDVHAQHSFSLVRLLRGDVKVRLEFAPRPDYGQVSVRLQPLGDGLLVLGSSEPISLSSPGVDWEIDEEGDIARAVVDLAASGGQAVLELRPGSQRTEPHPVPVEQRRTTAEAHWRDWADRLQLPALARAQVLRSALTLRALCYEPAGSILAAATTSLPEEIGGIRNWDYRYCWLRDAAMTARALVDLGSTEEAEALLAWTLRVVEGTGGHPERLHPLYALDGSEVGTEASVDILPGYAGSRPVRVGNVANRQVQLDVFAPVADLIAAVAERRGYLTESDVELMEAMVAAVERRWHEPDNGLWEIRLAPQHYVYSKVMCWFTVHRAIQAWQRHQLAERPDWTVLRDSIAANVLKHGWHDEVGAFTMAYDDPALDASALWVGLSGLLSDDDPRFLATVLKVEAELRSGPTVYRYLTNDGLPGREGGFHLCTTWLVEAYLRTGRRADAERLFAQLLECAGPTDLLPEQYDPDSERGLGNHPQAYSHLGLIRCALLLDQVPAARATG
jgi:trehalose-phosphatase